MQGLVTSTKRIVYPAELALGRGPEVQRRIRRTDAAATAKGACKAVVKSEAAALPPASEEMAMVAERIEGEDRG